VSSVWDDVVGQPAAVQVLRAAAAAAAGVVAAGVSGAAPDAAGSEAASSEAAGSEAADSAGGGVAGWSAGGMTHAWLFTGPPGSGRSVAARAFAAALQCPDGGCGACRECRTALAGTHADVHLVVPEGLSIAVQEMRAIVRTASRRPSAGRWQVVVIEDADRLTEAASNALLKAVEEPPARTVFLLCAPSTHPEDVSVTIRSRCRVVPLRAPAPDAVAEVLVRRDGIRPDLAGWAAHAGQGHIGRARRLATDSEARDRRAAVLAVPAALRSLPDALTAADGLVGAAEAEAQAISAGLDGPEAEALKVALGAGGTGKGTAAVTRGTAGALRELERRQKSRATRAQRDALDRALIDLAGFYRDVLAVQFGATVPMSHPDFGSQVRAVAAACTPAQALARLEAILACRTELELNVKPRIAVQALTAALRP
jgi:DNA polymerase III subunit delta'